MKDVFIDFNVKFGLEKIWKWKLWIVLSCVVAGIIAIFLSFKMADEYKNAIGFHFAALARLHVGRLYPLHQAIAVNSINHGIPNEGNLVI